MRLHNCYPGGVKITEKLEKKLNKVIKKSLEEVRGYVTLPTGLTDEEVLKLYKEYSEIALPLAKNDKITEVIENYFKEELGIEMHISTYHVWDLSSFE